ncbi:MAG: hypothetical protein IH989_08825, partial [Planctomycetes bacterium]|nr:hypothetical protein [Planctomycetota bacterium]
MEQQRYVSNELTHFVGRDDTSPEAKFARLKKIIETGNLQAAYLYPWHTPPEKRAKAEEKAPHFLRQKLGETREGPSWGPNTGGSSGSLMGGTLLGGTALCFCDIPVADLAIHMSRYGHFGLSFRKSFLAGRGATPVFYVAKDAIVGGKDLEAGKPLGSVLDEVARDLAVLLDSLQGNDPLPGSTTKPLFVLIELNRRVLGLIQGFDAAMDARDEQNCYMEREWRMLRSLHFELDDVYRV